MIPIELPPLRERRDDVLAPAEHFLARLSAKHGRRFQLSADAATCLLRYPWPGNVRELENAMERSAILAHGETLESADLPPHIATGIGLGPSPTLRPQQSLAEIERAHIVETLERCGWNHSRAAEALGIGRTTLWRKLKEYGLDQIG